MATCLLLMGLKAAMAQRVPVLEQISLPHSYYYRELYLPQLTSGPSAVSWTPDGETVIFSMAGKLWQQVIHQDIATQLTDGDGYDYQPDVSPDGRHVVFVRYNGDAMELYVLDLTTHEAHAVTENHAVNVEPRWSPDGRSIAFVSTDKTGHFLLHTASYDGSRLQNVALLTPDRESKVQRYYYSSFDHAINPAWSSDGQYLYFVSNREIIHGTGDIVRISIATGEILPVHHEETSWRVRPDVSPDDTRLVYSSYLGRNWQQLWLLPAKGGNPIPLTYGEFDNVSPRWSPDGKHIAFISNRSGNTSLWLIDVFDGGQRELRQRHLNFIRPRLPLLIKIVDEKGNVVPTRLSCLDERGQFVAPRGAWIHADDSRYPHKARFEAHYIHSMGIDTLWVPIGQLALQASHGPAYEISKKVINVSGDANQSATIALKKISFPDGYGPMQSADLHVHMNYGGHYRNDPATLARQADAEDLPFVFNLIVNKEQRIPDADYFTSSLYRAPEGNSVIQHAQEFHTSSWGHLGLLNLREHLIVPDYSAYPQTAVSSSFPHNRYIADRAHAQQGVVGYVHPFEKASIFPQQSASLYHELPVDVALGKINYYELIGFADHQASAAVWYQLLNCGIHLPAGAGTDAMANYASLRGPVGLNRVYVPSNGGLEMEDFLDKVVAGKSFVTNGPLIGLEVAGHHAGDSLSISSSKQMLPYSGFMRSQVPIDHVEILCNGEVIATHNPKGDKKTLDFNGKLTLRESGWLLMRVWNEHGHPDIFDLYPYASTNPLYIKGPVPNHMQREAGKYFLEWVRRIKNHVDALSFRNATEKTTVLDDIIKAEEFYVELINGKK